MADDRSGGRVGVGLTLALCMAAALLEGFDNQSIGAVAPRLIHAFHLKPEALGQVLSASTFGLLVGSALGGRLSDRFGFRGVLVATIGLMGLASLATAFAYDAPSLFAARFVTGLGLGGSLPNVLALVSGSVRHDRRGAAVSAVYAGLPFGGAIAAAVTLLGSADEWRLVFLIGGAIPLLLAPAMALLPARVGSRHSSEKRDVAPIPQVLFGGGRASATLLLWAGFVLTLLILYLMLNWLPTLMTSRGYDRATVAWVQFAFNLFGALACLCAGALLDGRRRVAFIVTVFVLLGLSLVGLGTVKAAAAVEVALGGALGAMVLLAQAIFYDAAPRLYPEGVRGTGVGWAVSLGRIGSIAGPLLGAVLVAHGASPSSVLLRLLPIVAIAGVAALLQTWRARAAHARAGVETTGPEPPLPVLMNREKL